MWVIGRLKLIFDQGIRAGGKVPTQNISAIRADTLFLSHQLQIQP